VTAGTDGCVVFWEVNVDKRIPVQTPRFSARTISARFRRSMDDILRHEWEGSLNLLLVWKICSIVSLGLRGRNILPFILQGHWTLIFNEDVFLRGGMSPGRWRSWRTYLMELISHVMVSDRESRQLTRNTKCRWPVYDELAISFLKKDILVIKNISISSYERKNRIIKLITCLFPCQYMNFPPNTQKNRKRPLKCNSRHLHNIPFHKNLLTYSSWNIMNHILLCITSINR